MVIIDSQVILANMDTMVLDLQAELHNQGINLLKMLKLRIY